MTEQNSKINNPLSKNPPPSTFHQPPSTLGYHMPAEWEPHEGTWLSWPKNSVTWPEQLQAVEEIYIQMIEILTQNEKVFLLVNDETSHREIFSKLSSKKINSKNLILYQIPTVDAWIRDYGPNFLVREINSRKELAFNNWIFNAWGGKYESIKKDDSVPQQIKSLLNVPVFEPGMVLEGGSIDVNGQGTCLTTEQCLLAPSRNPNLDKNKIENKIKDCLNVSNIIWLGEGIVGDDTDGHVDDIARFVNPTTIVCALEDNPKDDNYEALQENYKRLKSAMNEKHQNLNIITLPMPGPVFYKGERLPASYANFYIANGVVLVPIFGHPHDTRALNILQSLFSDRNVLGIRCESMVVGHGAIHCVTQQQPQTS